MDRPWTLAVALALAASFCAPAIAGDPPARVMSTNVCTDQLALLLAKPGQLVSVSINASDPRLSALHDRAAGIAANTGRAEEVFLLHPDLVVAADYSLHGLSGFVRQSGIALEEFSFASTIDQVPADLRRMGAILGNADEGERLAAAFEARRQDLRSAACAKRPTALMRGQNGIVQGAGTIAGSALEAAGFENIAATLGYQGMTPFPLEQLVAARPDVIILSERFDDTAASLADAAIDHPALAGLRILSIESIATRGALTCAAPMVLDVAEALSRWRRANFPCVEGEGS